MIFDLNLVGSRVISAPGTGPDGQNVRLLSHHEAGPYRLRVSIQIDRSYPNQSRNLTCVVWKPRCGWVEISKLLYSEQGKVPINAVDGCINSGGELELLRLEALLLERALWVLDSE